MCSRITVRIRVWIRVRIGVRIRIMTGIRVRVRVTVRVTVRIMFRPAHYIDVLRRETLVLHSGSGGCMRTGGAGRRETSGWYTALWFGWSSG